MPRARNRSLLALLLLPLTAQAAAAPMDIAQCVVQLDQAAADAGISAATREVTLADIDLLERVIDADRAQPEFRQTFWEYVTARVSEDRVQEGRDLLREHYRLLHDIYLKYGVRPEYLLSFWGLETNYGSIFGGLEWLDALATLACDQRRSDYFTTEFVTALSLHDKGLLDATDVSSSWAGAIGHTQFMPTTVRAHAVDHDGDGRIDLFNSLPDALASAANYLKSMGWNAGERWGREVIMPDAFDWSQAGLDKTRTVTEWRATGIRDAFGRALPVADMPASLLLPMGHRGPAFLVYENFHTIMRWNRSIAYAAAVGHLADRIAGMGRLAAGEPDDSLRLSINEIREIQQRLNDLGIDTGEPDGVAGRQTRDAVRRFQARSGLPVDGYPDRALLQRLRGTSR